MFCRLQLGELAHRHEEFKRRNARILAVSADPADESADLAGLLEREAGVSPLWFPLLQDPLAREAGRWGVKMDGEEIAVPATFILDRTGRIRWTRVGESVTDRPAIADMLGVLDALDGPISR